MLAGDALRLIASPVAWGIGAHGPAYSALQAAVGSTRLWAFMRDQVLRPRAGLRVLDVGCGPADVLSWLPEVDYLGIDLSPTYVAGARRRHGAAGRFEVARVQDLVGREAPFDLVLCLGLLHHLDDSQARAVLGACRQLTAADGRLVSLDGCRAPRQPRLAPLFFALDRGRHTRDETGYRDLVGWHYPRLQGWLRHDLLRVPYSYLALEARPGATIGPVTRTRP